MALNEQIVTGRKFRKCIDAVNKAWQRISFWTKACDVEFDDGQNAEVKVTSIIMDLEQLNSNLTDGGKITEVKIVNALPSDAAGHPTTFYWVKG